MERALKRPRAGRSARARGAVAGAVRRDRGVAAMTVEVRIPHARRVGDRGHDRALAQAGRDAVEADEPLLELETDKATMEIPAGASGRLAIVEREGETVRRGRPSWHASTEARRRGGAGAAEAVRRRRPPPVAPSRRTGRSATTPAADAGR